MIVGTGMVIDFARIENEYIRDILAQPAALAATVEGLRATPELLRIAGGAQAGQFERIILTGMGGSYHVLLPSHLELIAHGWNCFCVETSELLRHMPRLLEGNTLVVALSQSGRSAELVRLGVQPRSGKLIAVTNTPGSPLFESADAVVLMRAGEEHSVSCKTSVASLAALRWLSELLRGGDLGQTVKDLAQSAAAGQSYLQQWREHVAWLAGELEGVRDLFLLGRGPSLAAAGLGGCIIKEAAHFHAEGMSAAAFRHGPMEMLSGETFVVIFAGGEDTAPLAYRLADDVRSIGARAAVVDYGADSAAFRLPEVPAGARPVVELLPPQMISIALAALRGRDPGRFQNITKVTTVE